MPASQDQMFLMGYLFLTEMITEHVSSNSQFGLVMSYCGVLFVVCAIFSPTCKDYNPTRVFDMDDGQFTP